MLYDLKNSHYKINEIATTFRLGNSYDQAFLENILRVINRRMKRLEDAISSDGLHHWGNVRDSLRIVASLSDDLLELEDFGYCADGRYNALVQMDYYLDRLEGQLENIRDVLKAEHNERNKKVRI